MREETTTRTLYTFDELSEKAKEKARDWYREGALDYDWWEFIYSDAATVGAILGLDLAQKPVKLMNGSTRYDTEIYFSGFYHQGSGSSYGARWDARNVQPAQALADHAPQDKELARIHAVLLQLAQENPELCATVTPKDDTWINVEVTHGETRDEVVNNLDYQSAEYDRENAIDGERADALEEALKDFNHWIYTQLRKEYEWQNADEQVDESIRANEYEFTEDGKIA